jgi:signal peptidase II
MSRLVMAVERRGYFLLALVVLALDQVTKALAHRHLRGAGVVELIPNCFNLWYSRNQGGLFGYFSDWPDPWRTLLLTLLPLVAIVLIAIFLAGARETDRPTLFGLASILGGATGNLVDRVVRGEVIDFLDAYAPPSALANWLVARFGTAHWPTFNVADSAIVCGAGLLLLSMLRPAAQRAGVQEPS